MYPHNFCWGVYWSSFLKPYLNMSVIVWLLNLLIKMKHNNAFLGLFFWNTFELTLHRKPCIRIYDPRYFRRIAPCSNLNLIINLIGQFWYAIGQSDVWELSSSITWNNCSNHQKITLKIRVISIHEVYSQTCLQWQDLWCWYCLSLFRGKTVL